jgi:hypothetical protein
VEAADGSYLVLPEGIIKEAVALQGFLYMLLTVWVLGLAKACSLHRFLPSLKRLPQEESQNMKPQ